MNTAAAERERAREGGDAGGAEGRMGGVCVAVL